MRRLQLYCIFSAALVCLSTLPALAQQLGEEKEKTRVKNWKTTDLKQRSNDHLMAEFGYQNWANAPSSFRMRGFHHYFGFSFFYDMPFKTNPHFSIAPGLYLGFNRAYFDRVRPNLTAPSNRLVFQDMSNTERYESTGFFYTTLAAQMEFRYISNPLRSERSFKAALGLRIGWIVDAYNRDVDKLDANGTPLETGTFTAHSVKFVNFPTTTFTLRAGYGVISVIASYQVNSVFTSASGAPTVNPFSIGLALGGL